MTLQYRVIVVQLSERRFEAYVRAFPDLNVSAPSAGEAIEAARAQMARTLIEFARNGRRAPTPDREAVTIELVSVPVEAQTHYRANVQIEITTGRVYKDGEELAMRGSALALLISLATETRDISIDHLCERLYPGIPSDQAYSALKMCVYRARKQLGAPGVIETTQRGYRLSEHVVVDVRFLPQIVRAIRERSIAKAIETRLESIFERLVAGRPAAYEPWVWFKPVENSLRASAREVGLYLAGRALRESNAPYALEIANELAALDPLDETARELEIRVHLSRGDRASAVRAFRRYADGLAAGHGMEPSPALRALIEASSQ